MHEKTLGAAMDEIGMKVSVRVGNYAGETLPKSSFAQSLLHGFIGSDGITICLSQ